MKNNANCHISIDELIDKIEDEAYRRKAKISCAELFRPQGIDSADCEFLSLKTRVKPRLLSTKENGYHINEFLKYSDRDFVTNAYIGILRREPDSQSHEYFLQCLRSGKLTKAEILGRLRYSPEGRKRSVRVKGLFVKFVLQSSYKIPLIGYLIRLMVGFLNFPTIIKNFEILEASVQNQFQGLNDFVNQNNHTLARKINEVISRQMNSHKLSLILEMVEKSKVDRKELEEVAASKVGWAQFEEIVASKVGWAQFEEIVASKVGWTQFEEIVASKVGWTQLEEIVASKVGWTQLEEIVASKVGWGQLEEIAAGKVGWNEFNEVAASKEDVSRLETLLSERVDKISFDQFDVLKADRTELTLISDDLSKNISEINKLRRTIVDQERRLRILLEETRRYGRTPDLSRLAESMANETDHFMDSLYVTFEDQFRGTRHDIKQRLEVYLPFIQETRSGTIDMPILDLGCGRGEWLELCKERRLLVKGIDTNRVMVQETLDMGLDVEEADMFAYLRSLEANTVGTITSFHVIEHLAINDIITLFDEILRVLKPNGWMILETPNPDNIIVSSRNFYMDPTHNKPLPSLMLKYLAEARGFNNIKILGVNPPVLRDGDENIPENLRALFCGPQDYALIASKQ